MLEKAKMSTKRMASKEARARRAVFTWSRSTPLRRWMRKTWCTPSTNGSTLLMVRSQLSSVSSRPRHSALSTTTGTSQSRSTGASLELGDPPAHEAVAGEEEEGDDTGSDGSDAVDEDNEDELVELVGVVAW